MEYDQAQKSSERQGKRQCFYQDGQSDHGGSQKGWGSRGSQHEFYVAVGYREGAECEHAQGEY